MACTSASACLCGQPLIAVGFGHLGNPAAADELLVVTRIERKWLKRDQLDARPAQLFEAFVNV
ncbi:hypothetical protein A5906_09490 [Bradyrhizobium sacchari]|uniref:hypothetical protein n=1 Tax=Bradyrhizobium sacchari TaxID=1399419 RepID=UPI0009CF9E33|nr:hypothetical protein [Bradyrhizobium sacchari]OPY95233.1 hypothetical protein A5906_09490 [Bradyrhizobium sacchari]